MVLIIAIHEHIVQGNDFNLSFNPIDMNIKLDCLNVESIFIELLII